MKDRSLFVVGACFFLSGLAALIYQTAWTREFSFVFGTSELAVATVLAAYMAGLAGGAALGGRIAHRTTRPLALYGLLELGIGVAALLVPVFLFLATRLLVVLFGGKASFEETNPLAISIFYLVVTFVVVMIPTSFMGATLPLLSRHAVRRDHEIGPRIGALYAVNTAGAVAGTLFAAFVLLPALGIRQTVYVAVGINLLVFLIAIYLVRVARLEAGAPMAPLAGDTGTPSPRNLILPLMAVSGALSFTYEVLWVRLLSQLLGGSIYAFSTMLASFLAGIAIGSAIASRLATTSDRARRLFVSSQLGIAVLTLAAFYAIDYTPALTRWLAFDDPLAIDVCIAIAILLPSATCIGATFPFAVRIVARDAEDAGPASARVYSWNTVGAIVGSVGAAFVLLPGLGFRGTIALGITLNLAIAALAGLAGARRTGRAWVPVVAWLLLILVLPGEPWQILRSSPINRQVVPKRGIADYYAVGRGATVLLTRNSPVRWRLSTNGLPESMISAKADTPNTLKPAVMLGAIGAMVRPEARSMLVVGLGGGVTIEDVPQNIERIDVVEIESEVVAANRWLSSQRRTDPLSDPRVHVHEGDARSALQLTERRFDVIAAQASHPWTAGASHLYTREFFGLVADRLGEDGVFVQWVGVRFVNLDLIRTLVRTLYEHFDYVHLYSGFLFVASNAPIPAVPDLERLRALDPDLPRRTGLYAAVDFAPYLRLDAQASRAFSDGAEITTDDRNLLLMRSPLLTRQDAKQREERNKTIQRGFLEHDPFPRLTRAGILPRPPLITKLLEVGNQPRARRLVPDLANPLDRAAIAILAGNELITRERLENHLRRQPQNDAIRGRLVRVLVAGAPTTPIESEVVEWTPTERGLLEAARIVARNGPATAAPFDVILASISPLAPYYLDAVQLRVRWRLASGDPDRMREALRIVDDAYVADASLRTLLTRANVGQALSDPLITLASLDRVESRAALAGKRPALVRIRRMLLELPLEGELARWREDLLRTKFRLQ